MIRTSGNPPHIGAAVFEIPHFQISNAAQEDFNSSNFSDELEEKKNQEAQIQDGNFKTPRPESLEPEDCEEIEKTVRELIELHKEGGGNQLAQKHTKHLEDL